MEVVRVTPMGGLLGLVILYDWGKKARVVELFLMIHFFFYIFAT